MTQKPPKSVESFVHEEAARLNIPTAELEPLVSDEEKQLLRVEYERRNQDLDPQLVWRGKAGQDMENLVVQVPPLYI